MMIYRKWHKGDKVHSLDEHLEKKLESMEIYYVKYIASMVAKEKILVPRLQVRNDGHLMKLILDYVREIGLGDRVALSLQFFREVVEWIHVKAGYFHIKQYLAVPEQEDIQKSLLFWT